MTIKHALRGEKTGIGEVLRHNGYATAIKVEALAQLGRMLKDRQPNPGTRLVGGNRFSGGTVSAPPEDIPTLAELGLDKKTSKLAQDIATIYTSGIS